MCFTALTLSHLSLRSRNQACAISSKAKLFGLRAPINSADTGDRYTYMTTVKQYYSPNYTAYEYFSSRMLLRSLQSANVFIIQTHGANGLLFAIDSQGVQSQLWADSSGGKTIPNNDYIGNLTPGAFRQLKFAYVASCNSYKMAETLTYYSISATTVGETDKVFTMYERVMLMVFNFSFRYGRTVRDAVNDAHDYLYNTYNTYESVNGQKCTSVSSNPYIKYSDIWT